MEESKTDIKDIRERLKALFRSYTGNEPLGIKELPLSGSNRRYFRIQDDEQKLIGTFNTDKTENKAFFYLAGHLLKSGVSVPKVIIKDEEHDVYIQEDLGDLNLFQLVTSNEVDDSECYKLYTKVIDQMPLLQYEAARNMDFSICYPNKAFDEQAIQWDLNYFKYMFLKLTYVPFHEQKLENDFKKLTQFLQEASSNFFLFRDFQSRNIMMKDEEPYFIDFQGGRRGALQYDLASLLFESKTGLSATMRERLMDYYIMAFSKYDFFDKDEFLRYYPAFVLIRLFQAFGAYGYRGLFEKKAFFVHSISRGLEGLSWVRNQTLIIEHFPYLCEIIDSMLQLKEDYQEPKQTNKLLVSITSFSYKKGIPDDWSGNGGGFVFDCRALPNPGREERYRSLTGRDREVVEYLEKETDVQEFVKNTSTVIRNSVTKYVQRGFSHLSICFGCTGGQHRSVYSAEKIFQFLKLNFDVTIRLLHREQNLTEWHD